MRLYHIPLWPVSGLETGQVETAQHGVSSEEQNIPALMSTGALKFLEGRPDFAQSTPHLRTIGAAVNLRTYQAGHHVLDVAYSAREASRRPSTANSSGGVTNFGQREKRNM